jgi:hypothetical protein
MLEAPPSLFTAGNNTTRSTTGTTCGELMALVEETIMFPQYAPLESPPASNATLMAYVSPVLAPFAGLTDNHGTSVAIK